MVVTGKHKCCPPLRIPKVTLVGDKPITVASPARHRAVLLMLAKANNEDEDKTYGQQDDGRFNLRNVPKVPKMAASPDVTQIGPDQGISAYESFTGWASVASIENTEANEVY